MKEHDVDRETTKSGANSEVIVACGSLARELRRAIDEEHLACDLRCLDPLLCFRPWDLRDALETKLRAAFETYRRIYLVYGMCAPDIDWLADTYGARRSPVAHCYELLAGPRFRELVQEEMGTYFLSPSLCRDFERRVVCGMGLEMVEQARQVAFARYKRVVYLRMDREALLQERAEQAAAYLGLPLQIEDIDLTHVKDQLRRLTDNGRRVVEADR